MTYIFILCNEADMSFPSHDAHGIWTFVRAVLSGRSKGAPGVLGQNSFIFMQFSSRSLRSNRFAHYPRVGALWEILDKSERAELGVEMLTDCDCSCYCLNQASLTMRTRGRAGKFPVGGKPIGLKQLLMWRWWLNSPWAPGHICRVSVLLVVVVVLLFLVLV